MVFLSYRSLPFIGIIIANIEMIEYGNVEFIISDRHLLDHTLALLQQKYGNDKRFRFLSSTDQLNWAWHFNLILRHARGEYALWMAHDDSVPVELCHRPGRRVGDASRRGACVR